MAGTKTVLDFPAVTTLETTDIMYLIRGSGTGRDKSITASVLQEYIGDNVVQADTTGAIDLDDYFSNLVVKSDPSAAITLTFSGTLPNGKKLIIWNQSENIVTTVINSTNYPMLGNQILDFVSNGTTMGHLYNAQTFIAPGMMMMWNGNAAPSTYGIRALLCNGQGILAASYPSLVTACYVGDVDNATVAGAGGFFFRADNSDGSSPNAAGDYFILPETRGLVPRGLDTTKINDDDGDTRYLGSKQNDQMQKITGTLCFSNNASANVYPFGTQNPGLIEGVFKVGDTATEAEKGIQESNIQSGRRPLVLDSSLSPNARVSSTTSGETRMRNFATKYVIFY